MPDEMPAALKHDLNYGNTGYEQSISPYYEVVCMGGVSIDSVESVTLPLLRQVYPENPLVFVYGKQHEWDYQLYIADKYGSQYYYRAVAGNADVDLGMQWPPLTTLRYSMNAHIWNCAQHTETVQTLMTP